MIFKKAEEEYLEDDIEDDEFVPNERLENEIITI